MATPAWHILGIPEIDQQLGTHSEGLTDKEVAGCLQHNEQPESEHEHASSHHGLSLLSIILGTIEFYTRVSSAMSVIQRI